MYKIITRPSQVASAELAQSDRDEGVAVEEERIATANKFHCLKMIP